MEDGWTGSVSTAERVAQLFVEQIGLLDPELLAPLLAEQFEFRTMLRSDDLPLRSRADRATFLAFLVQARDLFPNLCPHRVVSIMSQGDRVAIESECEAIMSNGRRYANAFSFHFTMDKGRIKLVKEYTDFHHTAQVIFAPT